MKIKNLFLVLIIMIICFSCDIVDNTTDEKSEYSIITIDSCEYIECDYGVFETHTYSLTHKGNCKYCAERARRLVLEIKNNEQ